MPATTRPSAVGGSNAAVAPNDGTPPSGAYLVITDKRLEKAFAGLARARARQGFVGEVVTVESIKTKYGGADTQEGIRRLIQEYHGKYHRLFVALGGDDQVVPVRYCYAKAGKHDREYCLHLPTDLYYADTNGGTWDADHDGIYGEMGEDDAAVDLSPEVYVGRIPVRTPEEALAYVHKVAAYESSRPKGFANTMLLVGNTDYLTTVYESRVKPYWQASVLCVVQNTLPGWPREPCLPAQGTDLASQLSAGYHHVVYSGHGKPGRWGVKGSHMGPAEAAALNNGHRLSIIRGGGCGTAWFDGPSDPCIAEAFLRNPRGGAVVYVGFSRTAYGGTGPQYQDTFYEELFRSAGVTVGEAFTRMKQSLAGLSARNRWHQYTYCLLGDPAIAPWRDHARDP